MKPVSALKGGDPHARQRMMRLLVAAQVAFCVLVLFVAGLFMPLLTGFPVNARDSLPSGFSPWKP